MDSDKNRLLLEKALERFRLAADAERTNLEEAYTDLRFRAGEQWEDHVLVSRQKNNVPCPVINQTGQFVKQVVGDMRRNRPRIKVRPVDGGDQDKAKAEIFEGLIREIERNSDADSVYLNAADTAVTCGIAHWRVLADWEDSDSFNQNLRIRPINDPFAVLWDPNSRDVSRKDADWCFVLEDMTEEAFKEEYPDAALSNFGAPLPELARRNRDWFTARTVKVAEYWYKKPVRRKLVRLADGSVLDVTGRKAEEVAALAPQEESERDGKELWRAVLTGTEVLEAPKRWVGQHIPVVPLVGEEVWVGDRLVRHGAVRWLRDPQRIYNYMRAVQMEVMQQQLSAPFVGTKKQFEGNEQYWARANQQKLAYLPFTPDPQNPGAPQRQPPPLASPALTEQVALAEKEMRAVTGIYDAALGQRSNEQSGKAILARQAEADTAIAVFMDNLAQSIKHTGRILVELIPHYYSARQVIRILNEDGTEAVTALNVPEMDPETGLEVVMNDINTGRFDVDIQTGPGFNTKRQEAAESMMQFAQAVPNAAAVIGDLIAKNMDWPGSEQIADRLRKVLPPNLLEGDDGQPLPPPQPDPVQELQVQKAQADAQKAQAEAEGKRLDNMQKQMEMAAASGQLQQIVMQAVQQQLMQILSGQPPQQPIPQPGMMPTVGP